MNIYEAWANGRLQLTPHSPTPELDARLLLEHVLQVSHSYLLAHGDERLTAVQATTYQQLLVRARRHEPIPYLVGHAPFYGLDFLVSPAVLIPRPETEQLVELAIAWADAHCPAVIVDVGTGSGCIAIAIAHHLGQAHLFNNPIMPQILASDTSPEALAIAQQNAQTHTPGQVQFYHGSLLEPIPLAPSLIVANLPYIAAGEWTKLDDGVKLFEPQLALAGGVDGLDLIRQLLQQATIGLVTGGALMLEIGWQQGPAAQQAARTAFPKAQVRVMADYAGHDRFVVVETAVSAVERSK